MNRPKCSTLGCTNLARNKGRLPSGEQRFDSVCHSCHRKAEPSFKRAIDNSRCEMCGWDKAPCDCGQDGFTPTDPTPPITSTDGGGAGVPTVAHGWAVRRLTPTECERLQGYKDGFTLVEYRGKPAADGPRYKALGNSMAVPVMRWILRRIVEAVA
jgi:site-specific DNA-cytosine methylase